jgi:hypothetical protein
LEGYRLYHRLDPHNGLPFWDARSPAEKTAMRALEAAEVGPKAASELPPEDGEAGGLRLAPGTPAPGAPEPYPTFGSGPARLASR